MADSYYVTLRKVENAMRELHQDVEERNKIASTQGVTAKKDTVIRNQVKSLQKMVEQLLAEVEMYEKDQDQYNLSSRELGLRRKKAYDLKNDFEEIKKKVSGLHQKKPSKYDNELDPREKFGDKYNADGMSQQEAKELTKKLRDEQEDMLDQIGDTVAVIKTGQLAMKEELDYHNKVLLPEIEVGVDRNLTKTQKSNARVVKLLNSRSNCSLYMIIAAEIILLLVQLIILP